MEFLDNLWVALQPIVSLKTGAVVGHESLIRGPVGSGWENPEELFALAQQTGKGAELEARCRQLGIDALTHLLPEGQTLFLNVAIEFPQFPPDLVPSDVHRSRIAIEISERTPIVRHSSALQVIDEWRSRGHLIVLDDYGAGYSSLGMAIAVRPDILKFDREMISGIDSDPFRYDVLQSVVNLWHDNNVRVLAEGIETAEELAALQSLGIDYGQGHYIGRPQATPCVDPILHVTNHRRQAPDSFGVSPYDALLGWSDANQSEWDAHKEGLNLLRPVFLTMVSALLNDSLPDERWHDVPIVRLKALVQQYGLNLTHDPRDPEVRDRARRLGLEHRRALISPAWFVMLYNYYFPAYHQLQAETDSALPRLFLFRRRWLLDLADTLDVYARPLR